MFGQPTPTPQSSLALFCPSTREPIEPIGNRPHSPIHILNNDALLNIFHLYRLDVLYEYGNGHPNFNWSGERWWYKLAQVCRWWRYLVLASPSQLNLHLLCTNGVHVASMLAHSPPLPLTIYYRHGESTEEDEEGIFLALKHSDRVHYIGLWLPTPTLRIIITTMDEQFPTLERLYIASPTEDDRSLVFPRSFQAPHLRHLFLMHAALPIGSPFLTTAVGLVTLILRHIPSTAYFSPGYLLARFSLMPQLEMIQIHFHSPLPNRDVARQLLGAPIMTPITLPNLRVFSFKGVSAYMEGLLTQISAPVLTNLEIILFNQLTVTVPRLLQFMGTSESLSFNSLQLIFDNDFAELVAFELGEETRYFFTAMIRCRHFDWQVSSSAQILSTLQPVFSVVETLTLIHGGHDRSSEWHNEIDCTQWRQLLRPFSNLKTLHVQNELLGKLARSLEADDGELPLELLPNLKEVGYSGDDARKALAPFIDERQAAGHPVNLTKVDRSLFFR